MTLEVQAQGTRLRYMRILAMRDMSKIYLAAILRRGYPRRIVRAIDGSSIGALGGVSGWVHPPHYATLDTCERRTRAHLTYNNTDYWTREGWARVRCNKGDNGHYDRRVTSLETTNPLVG